MSHDYDLTALGRNVGACKLPLITSANATKVLFEACHGRNETAALIALHTAGCDVHMLEYKRDYEQREPKYTLEGDLIHTRNTTLLYEAISNNMYKLALALIAADVDVNECSKIIYHDAISPLAAACYRSWVEGVRALVDAGADVEYVMPDGSSARIIAQMQHAVIKYHKTADEIIAILDSALAVALHPLK